MNLRQLECFVALAEDGSFTKAAARLNLSQPSLSQQIRRLERELGGDLIERLPRGIRLTSAGAAFLPQAEAAVRAADRAASSARAALGLEAGELEVAILLSIAVGVLPHAITRWHERYPDVGIRMHEYTHRNLLEQEVRRGVGDLAVGPRPAAWPGPVEALGHEELVVVLPSADPLFGHGVVPLQALADRSWILFQPGHGLTEVVADACRAAGFQPRGAVRTTQVEAAVRLAVAGLGPAMVPDNCVSSEVAASVVRLDPPVLRELTAFARSDWSPLTSAFVEALKTSAWTRRPCAGALAV